MEVTIPPIVFRDKFDSYLAVPWEEVFDIALKVVKKYRYQEIFEKSSLYHKAFGMKLEKVYLVDEKIKFRIFSVHKNLATRIEVEPFKKNEVSKKILVDFYKRAEKPLFKFTKKQNILLSLPKIFVALLFILAPLIVIGGITIETLIISGFILNALISILFANIGKAEEEKWKNITLMMEEKPKKVEEIEKEEIEFGFDESDFGWE